LPYVADSTKNDRDALTQSPMPPLLL
jgi:hypothetical protein